MNCFSYTNEVHTENEIDFTPLNDYKVGWTTTGGTFATVATILFTGIMSFFVLAAISEAMNQSTWPAVVGTVTIVCAIVAFLQWTVARQRHNEAALRAFAAANDMQLQSQGEISGIGTLFGYGSDKEAVNVFSGVLCSMPFQLYEYIYSTGSGRNRQTYNRMVMELTLPRVMPQFIIDSTLEDVLPLTFIDKSQKIELEGDFHKYFDLYAPDKYGVSALTLLAPDTMEVLMQYAALCDVEIIQNRLYFYWPKAANSRQQYTEIFRAVQAVVVKLGKKLTHADIYAYESQKQIHTQPQATGVRLKRSLWIPVSGFVSFAAYLFMQYAQVASSKLYQVISFCIVFGIVCWVLMAALRRSRLKREYMKRYKSSQKA